MKQPFRNEKPAMKRWLLLGAGIAIGLGVLVRAVTSPAVATPPESSPTLPRRQDIPTNDGRWRVGWAVAVPGIIYSGLSADGSNIAWADNQGCVRRLLGDSGRMLWRTAPLSGVNHVAVAPDGSVVAYSRLNPDRNSVVVLHPERGDRSSRVFAGNGAVWSTAFGANNVAFIGTGGKSVYEVRDPATKMKPIATDGIPESLAIATDAPRIATGTWSPAGVLSCSLIEKRNCWRRAETEADRACRVALAADGSRIMVLSVRGAKETEGRVRVHDGKTGALLWEARLPDGAAHPTALFSANGEYVAVTYLRGPRPDDADDWRLAFFGGEGQRLFADKGSALFRPEVAAINADGSAITVLSGDETLFTLDRQGNFVAKLRFPPDARTGRPIRVKRVSSSADGCTLLLERRDDSLMLLRTGVQKR